MTLAKKTFELKRISTILGNRACPEFKSYLEREEVSADFAPEQIASMKRAVQPLEEEMGGEELE